jgi:hypothetical protein
MTRHRLRTLEAIGALVLAYGMVRTVPFSLLRRLFGSAVSARTNEHADRPPTDLFAIELRKAIASGARRLPWSSTCLMRALAGQLMLSRRGQGGEVVFGVLPGGGAFRAHAWLIAGGGTVCGGSEALDFSPIAAFRKESGPAKSVQ